MICPLVLVHPSEQHVQQIGKCVFLHRKLFFIVIKLSHHFVAHIDDVCGFLCFPEVFFFISFLDKESDVVEKADDYLPFLSYSSKYAQKMTAHILTSLVASTRLVIIVVDDILTFENFLQFIDAIVGINGYVLLIDLI